MIALGVAGQEERRHSDRRRAHAVRQAQPARRADQAARRVPAVLRPDAGGEPAAAGLTNAGTAREADARRGSQRRRLLARAPGRTRARVVSARLLRPGALPPGAGPDRSHRQHGRRSTLASLLQRVMGGHAHGGGERVAADSRGRPPAARPRRAQESRGRQERPACGTPPATARSTTIWPRKACRCPAIPPLPGKYGLQTGESAEVYYHHLYKPVRPDEDAESTEEDSSRSRTSRTAAPARTANGERGSCRTTTAAPPGVPGVDSVKAELVRREVAQRIVEMSRERDSNIPLGWRRWAHTRADAEGGLHGHHPSCRAQGPARQHAGPVRSHLPAAASPAGLLRRLHHGVLSTSRDRGRAS